MNQIDELEIELKILKKQKEELEKQINKIEKQLNENNDKIVSHIDIVENDTENAFLNYLLNVKKLGKRSANGYFGALKTLKKKIKIYEDLEIKNEIFNLSDLKILFTIKDLFRTNKDLISDNLKQHHIFSAAFNNYLDFITNYYNSSTNVNSEFLIDE